MYTGGLCYIRECAAEGNQFSLPYALHQDGVLFVSRSLHITTATATVM